MLFTFENEIVKQTKKVFSIQKVSALWKTSLVNGGSAGARRGKIGRRLGIFFTFVPAIFQRICPYNSVMAE